MTQTNGTAKYRDIVTYEDQANPVAAYIVTDVIVNKYGTEYVLISMETGATVTSDCRQYGWKTVGNLNEAMGF